MLTKSTCKIREDWAQWLKFDSLSRLGRRKREFYHCYSTGSLSHQCKRKWKVYAQINKKLLSFGECVKDNQSPQTSYNYGPKTIEDM